MSFALTSFTAALVSAAMLPATWSVSSRSFTLPASRSADAPLEDSRSPDRETEPTAAQAENPPKPSEQPVQTPTPEHVEPGTQERPEPADGLLTDATAKANPAPKVGAPPGEEPNPARAPGQADPSVEGETDIVTLMRSAAHSSGTFRFDYSAACDQPAYESMLEYLTQAFPDLAQVTSLGKSRSGRELWCLRAGVPLDDELDHRPAIFVCTSLTLPSKGAPAPSPNSVLYVAESLFMNARTTAEIERLFQRCTIYFAPAMDPDRAFADTKIANESGGAAVLARNFPAGWEPWGPAAFAHGPYPLSEPESRAVAAFLESHRNVCAVVMLDPYANAANAAASASEATRSVVPAPDPRAGEASAAERSAPGGSFESFCSSIAGARVSVRPVGRTELSDTPLGPAPVDFTQALAFVSELCTTLPELSCVTLAKERLRTELWMVDLRLSNNGKLSTRSSASGGSKMEPSVWMRSRGATLVAAAVRRGPDAAFEPLPGASRSGELSFLGDLDGGASFDLRLVVSSTTEPTLEVVFEALRAGRARVDVDLH